MPLRTDLLKLAFLFAAAGAAALWSVFASGCASAAVNAEVSLYRITIAGSSMEPVFHDGDKAVAFKMPYSSLKEDEFAVRRDSDKYVIHALTQKIGNEWVMQGLANPVPDAERLNEGNYVGWVPKPILP